MDEKIKEELLKYLQSSKDFILEQSPDVIQQALRYHYFSSLIDTIGFFILLLVCLVISFYNYKYPELTEYGRWESSTSALVFFPGIMAFVFFMSTCSNIEKFIKITIAPKYFLITLIK